MVSLHLVLVEEGRLAKVRMLFRLPMEVETTEEAMEGEAEGEAAREAQRLVEV